MDFERRTLYFVFNAFAERTVKSDKDELQSTKYQAQSTVLVIVIPYLRNLWKRNLDYVAVRALHFDTRSGECLSSLQAMDSSAHSSSVGG